MNDDASKRAIVIGYADDMLCSGSAPGDIETIGSAVPVMLVRISVQHSNAPNLDLYIRTATGDAWLA